MIPKTIHQIIKMSLCHIDDTFMTPTLFFRGQAKVIIEPAAHETQFQKLMEKEDVAKEEIIGRYRSVKYVHEVGITFHLV